MPNSKPLITVGFTCFNAENSIARAIASAQSQTWEDLEIVVVDDGSQDRSVEVVEGLAKNDPRIRLIAHDGNKGTPIARNTIAKNAKGEFLAFFDDDDTGMKDRLEKQYQRIIAYEQKHGADMVFCYCNRNVVLEGQTQVDHVGYGIGRHSPQPHGQAVADFILWDLNAQTGGGDQMGSGTLMLRTSVFEKVGHFDERFRRSAEWEFAVRAALQDAHFVSVDEPLITQNKTLTSDKGGKKPLEYALLLREAHQDYLKGEGMYNASRAIAYARFYGSRGDKWKARFFMLIAGLLAPNKILKPRLCSKFC